jgi:hypothetical protein
MIQSRVNFNDLVKHLVPGSILAAGVWYLYRPTLFKIFPFIIENVAAWGHQIKLFTFVIVSIVFGIFIHSLSDIAVIMVTEDDGEPGISSVEKFFFYALRIYGYFFSFSYMKDPRVVAIDRYLSSGRSHIFDGVHKSWGLVDNQEILTNKGKVIAHQHIINRLRAHSQQSMEAEKTLSDHLYFTCSVYLSVLILFAMSLVSTFVDLISNFSWFRSFTVASIIIVLLYVASVISTYVLKRRISHYYRQAMTLAVHFYLEKDLPRTINCTASRNT